MTRIPIDLAAPIACTVSSDEVPRRIEQVDHLRDRLRSIERTDTGLLLRFDPDAALEEHLQRFVVDEKGCCRFWGFEITSTDATLALRWEGPPDVQALLDELERWFRSDEPLAPLAGLL